MPDLVWLSIVLLFMIIFVVSSFYFCHIDYTFLAFLMVILAAGCPISILFAYNYFFLRLVRVKNDIYVPFTYQGYMEITPADKKTRRFIRDAPFWLSVMCLLKLPSGSSGKMRDKRKKGRYFIPYCYCK